MGRYVPVWVTLVDCPVSLCSAPDGHFGDSGLAANWLAK
jgi:hypothetical protein